MKTPSPLPRRILAARTFTFVLGIIAVIAIFASSRQASAAAITWTHASANPWNSTVNWSSAPAVPGANDNIIFSSAPGGTAQSITGITMEFQDITFSLPTLSRGVRNSSTVADSFLVLNGGRGAGFPLINVTTAQSFTIIGVGASHLLTLQLKASGDFNTDLAGSAIIISANITESGGARSINKTGPGTLTLSGASSLTGATTVTGGTLLLAGSLTGTAKVEVNTTLTTDAAASIATGAAGNLDVKNGGTLAPGGLAASAGTLTLDLGVGGKLDFASGSTFAFDLGTSSDVVAFASPGDWLSGGGAGTTLALNVTGSGFSYTNTYPVFQNVSTAGFSFGSITGYDTANQVAQFAQNGTTYEISFTAIPEPSALLSLAGGLGLLLGFSRGGLRFRRACRFPR